MTVGKQLQRGASQRASTTCPSAKSISPELAFAVMHEVGLVLAEDPVGGTQLKPNSVVNLTVGRYTTAPPPPTDTTPTIP